MPVTRDVNLKPVGRVLRAGDLLHASADESACKLVGDRRNGDRIQCQDQPSWWNCRL